MPDAHPLSLGFGSGARWLAGLLTGLVLLHVPGWVRGSEASADPGAPPALTLPSPEGEATSTNGLDAAVPPGPNRTNDLLLRRLFETQTTAGTDPDRAAYEEQLGLARQQRRSGELSQAMVNLIAIFRSAAPDDLRCPALFELALVAQDEGLLLRAQQILAQYIHLFPGQPGVIEAYLRQGLLLRQMGSSQLAIAKFFAVMSSALSLRLDQLEYYQRLVLQAQIEIADTYYQDGRWADAADYLKRVLKLDSKFLDRGLTQAKLVKALAAQGDHPQTIGQAQAYLEAFPQSAEVPEIRFLLARSLKSQGRRAEALQQVLRLLESQRADSAANPMNWAYWQKRVGNEVANELYSEGDYLGALEICQRLADLDASVVWQLPVQYQIGLVLERLNQPAKASAVYADILRREPEVAGTNGTPGLKAVVDMARWRQGNLGWLQGAVASVQEIQNTTLPLNPSPADETPGGNR